MTVSPQGLIASVAGASLAIAIAFAPLAPSAQTQPNGAVTPPGTPGQFSNSPQTTNAQGGQASVTVDDRGHLRAVGRSMFPPKAGTVRMMTHATPKPSKGTIHHGVYVAPRATLNPHP